MMEQVSMALPSGLRHESQIPANAKMESSAMVKQNGVFTFPFLRSGRFLMARLRQQQGASVKPH
jgi:hypothetical protein